MKWRWIVVGAVALVGVACVVLSSSDRPPYAFIDRLHGERIPSPWDKGLSMVQG